MITIIMMGILVPMGKGIKLHLLIMELVMGEVVKQLLPMIPSTIHLMIPQEHHQKKKRLKMFKYYQKRNWRDLKKKRW